MTNAATRLRTLNLIDIRRAAKRVETRGRRLPKPPRLLFPEGAERFYVRELRGLMAELHGVVVRQVVPALPAVVRQAAAQRPRTDAADAYDPIKAIIDLVRSQFFGLIDDDKTEALVRRVAGDIMRTNAGQIDKAFKETLGVDLFRAEPWLESEMKLFVQSNVDLIKAAGQKYLDDITQTIYAGARNGATASSIAEDLADRFDVAQSKAKFLARNQVAQFNGQLTQLRQTQAGVTRYVWRTSRDERVRATHRAMEGKVCDWDDPPSVGGQPAHPGQQINCRCWSEPMLEDLLP